MSNSHVLPALPPLQTAAIARLEAVVTLVSGRVTTAPVPEGYAYPYLVIGDRSERSEGAHYGQGGSESSFAIRGVVKTDAGDSVLMDLYSQVYMALHDYPLTPAGHQTTLGEIRYITDYPDPQNPRVRHFVVRYEATTSVDFG